MAVQIISLFFLQEQKHLSAEIRDSRFEIREVGEIHREITGNSIALEGAGTENRKVITRNLC